MHNQFRTIMAPLLPTDIKNNNATHTPTPIQNPVSHPDSPYTPIKQPPTDPPRHQLKNPR